MIERSKENREKGPQLYTFADGRFRIMAAYYGSWAKDIRKVFRVREDRDPKERAAEKGIENYDRILPANQEQVQAWLDSHPDYPLVEQD